MTSTNNPPTNNTDSLDANIPLRIIANDNISQRKRILSFLDNSKNTHYLSIIALSEIIYVLDSQYNYTRTQIVDGLNFFLTRYDTKIKYNHSLTSLAFPMFLANPKLSFNDCLLTAEAQISHHQPLITLDRKLANQSPSATLLPRSPIA